MYFAPGSEAITDCSAELVGPLPLSQLSGIVYFYPMSQYL
jgi:hypothetical protein